MTKHLDDLINWINYNYNLEDGTLKNLDEIKDDVKDFIANWDSEHQTADRIAHAQSIFEDYYTRTSGKPGSVPFETIIEDKIAALDQTKVNEILKFKSRSQSAQSLDEIESIRKEFKKLEVGGVFSSAAKQQRNISSQLGNRESYLEKVSIRQERVFDALESSNNLTEFRKELNLSVRATPNTLARQYDISVEEAEQVMGQLECNPLPTKVGSFEKQKKNGKNKKDG